MVVTIAIATLVISGMGAALGIVYGEPDEGEHPHVGSMVIHIPDPDEGDQFFQWCSGTLVEGAENAAGSDVFLTAAHCVAGLEDILPEGASVLVTFDEEITPGGTFFTGDIHFNPNYGTHGMADLFDVAVIVLDEPTGIGQYGVLPEAGLLDEMKAGNTLRDQIFTAVGYGTVRETRRGAFSAILDNERRNKADQEFLSLTKAWITMSMNEATGNAGTCYGDSGGPHFLEGTNTIVSVTVTGDAVCKATDKTYRLDTASARDFLADWVALP
jgi:secreted trypsin-like serine protease